jgi:hypothetical protein
LLKLDRDEDVERRLQFISLCCNRYRRSGSMNTMPRELYIEAVLKMGYQPVTPGGLPSPLVKG